MSVIEKAKDAMGVFKAGKVVADPAKWKTHQVSVNQVVALLAALVATAKAFGYDIHMDNETVAAVGAGVFALVNWVFTVATTDKIGVFGQRAEPAPAPAVVAASVARPAGDAPSSQPAAPAAPMGGEPSYTQQTGPLWPGAGG